METINIAVIIGSARKDSFTKKIAFILQELAPKEFNFNYVDITKIPYYEEDLEGTSDEPKEWRVFREQIQNNEALLFVTPEYNRSFPAIVKNALDVGSRPYGKSVWNDKPAGVVSISPGSLGGVNATNHLKQVLAFLNVHVIQQPEVYIASVHTLLDQKGKLNNKKTQEFLTMYLQGLKEWILKHR